MSTNNQLFPELDCTNMVQTWPEWKNKFIAYASGFCYISNEPRRIDDFLSKIGKEGRKIYHELFPNGYPRRYSEVLSAFDDYTQRIIDEKNHLIETFKFNQISQKKNQSFADFESELRAQMPYCRFKCSCGESYAERMLRDRIIAGMSDKNLQSTILNIKDINLKQIIDLCKSHEGNLNCLLHNNI